MARRIVILSKTSLEDGVGGVPVHCHYLKKVFPKAIHLTCSKVGVKKDAIQKMAFNLGHMAEQKGLIKSDDLVIADGFWGCGLSNQNRVIVVCHGILAGDVGVKHFLSQFQKHYIQGKHCIAVSRNSATECRKSYGVECRATIVNGVDLNIFHPPETKVKEFTVGFIEPQGKIQLAKYSNLIDKIKSTFKTRTIKGSWPYEIAEEYQKCSAYLHLSRYEGCSYAVNEALASGLPVIATPVGLLGDYRTFLSTYGISVGEVVPTITTTYEEVKEKILKIYHNYNNYKPVEWCHRYCNYVQFAKEWRNYVTIYSF